MQLKAERTPEVDVVSVTDLNRLAKAALESALGLMWVAGEISNFTRAASGHCYFSLKDAQSQVRCVMFRHKAQLQDWKPENGMQIEVRAYPSFYEARGEFQLNVETMRRSGLGALYAAFEKLKARLQAAGMFDATAKQTIPRYPRAIGIVTSTKAAALRDVLTTLKHRMPSIPVIVYPAAVQGEDAARQIAAAIALADERAECDVLIVCRGGGSIEDLWSFNEEIVAYAIYECRLPVVSGIGHESDFTIADFVADARAPTPTGAAQLVSPNRDDVRQTLTHVSQRLRRVTERGLERRMQQLDVMARRLVHPGERIAHQLASVTHLASRLGSAWERRTKASTWQLRELHGRLFATRPDMNAHSVAQHTLSQRLTRAAARRMDVLRANVASIAAQLVQLNPTAVLQRGYSLVEMADGKIVRDGSLLSVDDDVLITFASGWARARVKEKGQRSDE